MTIIIIVSTIDLSLIININHYEKWPTYDPEAIKEDTVEIGVQVNGKVRGTIEVDVNEDSESAISKAHELAPVKAACEGKTIVKEIYVKGKIVNIVVK